MPLDARMHEDVLRAQQLAEAVTDHVLVEVQVLGCEEEDLHPRRE
jgi:hypothetical protein